MELFSSLLFMLNEMSPYILLGFFIAGLLHAFISRAAFSRHLSGTGWKSIVKSALIGIPLPLCSCGVLPTAISMRRNGASNAASTSFLVATPQTGVDSIAATWSLLGPAFAIIRPIAALFTAVFGGLIVGKTEVVNHQHSETDCHITEELSEPRKSFGNKLISALRYGFIDLVASIGGWLVFGLVIAAIISVYVPKDFFSILGTWPLLSMIAVLIVAIPMYVCATGSIPIALSLVMKGLSPGTALVLLMAGPAANFASFTLISREMGRKTAILYLISISLGAIAFGLMIDYLLPKDWFAIAGARHTDGMIHHTSLISLICSAILVILLLYSWLSRFFKREEVSKEAAVAEYVVNGMNCSHCRAAVMHSISGVDGVTAVDVNLSSGIARVEGNHDPNAIREAIRSAGFDIE